MNAEKYGLDKIYFGGCFIRGKLLFCVECDSLGPDLHQATRRLLARCRMQYDFGAKARSALCSFDTKGSCMYSLPFSRLFCIQGNS
jgi:hypothetical protein